MIDDLIVDFSLQNETLKHGSSRKCLAISSNKDRLLMESCNLNEARQRWKFSSYNPSNANPQRSVSPNAILSSQSLKVILNTVLGHLASFFSSLYYQKKGGKLVISILKCAILRLYTLLPETHPKFILQHIPKKVAFFDKANLNVHR